ncbi:C6 transcription factor [Colletotrichum camelliae]|nr:C6 transcription factor [Colletotrichum camelliae]
MLTRLSRPCVDAWYAANVRSLAIDNARDVDFARNMILSACTSRGSNGLDFEQATYRGWSSSLNELKIIWCRVATTCPFNIERTPASLPLADSGQLESDPSDPDLAEVGGDVTQDVLEAVPQSHIDTLDTESPMQSATLMLPTAHDVFTTWFQSYHPWFPILHQGSFQGLPAFESPGQELVCKAVTAVVIFDQADSLPWHQARAAELRDQVLLQGVATSSLQSVQALLILSSHLYARGQLTEFWNVLAICKRYSDSSENEEKSTDVANLTIDYSLILISKGTDSTVQEEARRAFWMVEMLDAISTLGLPHTIPYSPSPLGASLPCLESQWSSTPTVIERSDSEPRYASGFALCIMLSVEELKVVREFLGRSYELDKLDQRLDWQSEAQRLDERLTNWREEFVAAVFQLINYEKEHLPRGEMESFFTLTNCILNEAIIVLLQQMAPMPKGIETTFEHWAFATTRCTYACENLTAKVRRIGADQLERESPYLISPLFVAARFYIGELTVIPMSYCTLKDSRGSDNQVYSKALDADVPANLHTLAFILHACGKRWPLAQLYETIIRTAVAEHRSPISECVLPVEFYDFRYTTLEITELLQSAGTKLT